MHPRVHRTAIAIALLVAAPAFAAMSGITSNGTGSTCTNQNSPDGDCVVGVTMPSASSTSFTSRMQWNTNANTSVGNDHLVSGTAKHNIAFNVSAPGGYRIDVHQDLYGDMLRNEDDFDCEGSAGLGGVAGTYSGVVQSGTLNLPNVPNIPFDTNDAVNEVDESASATMYGISNGATVSQTLNFQFDVFARSASCETAVRLGAQSGTTTGCDNCGYPGSPFSRVQADDGHWVTVTFTSLCGNGVVDSIVGEQCDLGSANNGAANTCCSASCKLVAFSTCRPAAGPCDIAETCLDTVNGTCPADGRHVGTLCRPTVPGGCDEPDFCNGFSVFCPSDDVKPAGTVCRAAQDACDVAESCTGSNTCPVDFKLPDGDADGTCDASDNCPDVDNDQSDQDGDGTGDVCDACTATQAQSIVQAKLTLSRLLPPAGDDSLSFKGAMKMPSSAISPSTTGVTVYLTNANGAPVVDAFIPPGTYDPVSKAGWRANSSFTSFTYKNKGTGTPLIQGIQTVKAKVTSPTSVKFTVKGKLGSYGNASTIPVNGALVFDPQLLVHTMCGGTDFVALPTPNCVISAGGNTVKCQ